MNKISDLKKMQIKAKLGFTLAEGATHVDLPPTKAKLAFTLAEGATHVDLPPTKVKLAFTLAEVLITLGVIGIVAAMTIPTLITNHQKKVTVTKLQRAISVFNQAYKQSFDDLGDPAPEEAYNMGTENYIKTYWAPYLKITNICDTYSDCGYKSSTPFLTPMGAVQGSNAFVPNSRIGISTIDGYFYIIFTSNWSATTGKFDIPSNWVWVDINGPSGPNTFGKDVFFLMRVEDKGVFPYRYDQPQGVVNWNCSNDPDPANQGTTCAEKIRRAGWEIDKSYPWK